MVEHNQMELFFKQFCQTLESDSRDMYSWLTLDLQENILTYKHNWNEVRA